MYTKSIKVILYNLSVLAVSAPIVFDGLFDVPTASSSNLTALLEKADCKNFASLLETSGVLKIFQDAMDKGLTLFAPTDEAFNSPDAPDLSSLSSAEPVTVLQYHALPSYNPKTSLKSVSGRFSTMASSAAGKYDLSIITHGDDVSLDTGVDNSRIASTILDDTPVCILTVESLLLPIELFGKGPAPAPGPAALTPAPTPAVEAPTPAPEAKTSKHKKHPHSPPAPPLSALPPNSAASRYPLHVRKPTFEKSRGSQGVASFHGVNSALVIRTAAFANADLQTQQSRLQCLVSQRTKQPLSDLVPDTGTFTIDDEVCHATKLRSQPCLHKVVGNQQRRSISTTKMLMAREANYTGRGRFSSSDCSHVLGRYLPVNGPTCLDMLNSQVYVSQFSADGSLFVAGFQGSRIKIYSVGKPWKVKKDIHARNLQWTITDTALSPDKTHLVYASLTPIIHIVSVGTADTESRANVTDIHEGLDFSGHDAGSAYSFGIFSVKYSIDGRELVAGSSDRSIYVYDLEADKLTLRCEAHENDVNSVTFADETGHLIFSGSDDHLCKVWDRRCFMTAAKAVGVLEGHIEGITFLDSRLDGRYFISNAPPEEPRDGITDGWIAQMR